MNTKETVSPIKIPYPPFTLSRDKDFKIKVAGPLLMTKVEFAILVKAMEDFQKICNEVDEAGGFKGREVIFGEEL